MFKFLFSSISSKYILGLLFCVIFINSAYSSPEAPEFMRTKNWNVEKVEGQTVMLTADVVFFNPNKIKAKLRELDLDIFLNDNKVGKLLQQDKVDIKAKSSFDIPIKIKINLAENQFNINNILGLLSNQKFLIDLKGYLKARVFLFPFKVKVDERQEFSIKEFF